jgi:uncharacterized protein with PIN domain
MPARFLLDAMLGTLATYLRICGYDAAYAPDEGVEGDDAVLGLSVSEDRTLLTRDVALAGRAPDAVLLESRTVEEQLGELAAAGYDLEPAAEPTRCGRCNGPLDRVGPGEPTPEYAPDPAPESGPDNGSERGPAGTAVWRCRTCGQCFWRGSHWEDVVATLADVG